LTGRIIDADATLFEVGRRLKYLSQARRRNCQKGKKNEHPITAKGMEGKRATARRERGQQGKVHRQNEKIYCIILNIHIHTHTFFQNIVFSGSLLLALLILSLYVCIYTYKAIHHVRTDAHTFSIYVCLSFLCVCDREGGGFPLSLDVCTLCRWVVENGGGEFEGILELLAS
jgi:hypothetical protein